MWRRTVLWQAWTLVLVGATLDFRYFIRKQHLPTSQANCFDYSALSDRYARAISEGWRPKKTTMMSIKPTLASFPTFPLLNTNEILARRIDRLLPNAEDIVKEHAKLVQDINGLRHVVFVPPLLDDNRDYDESVHHEVLEISATPRPLPKVHTTPKPQLKLTKSTSFPIILLGGQSQPIDRTPVKFSKPISLVGSSVSPLLKHPYPFVMQGSSHKPFRFCMNSMPSMMYTTTPRPGLLQRLLNSILPRGLGR